MKKSLLLSGLGGSLFPYLHYQLVEKFNLYYVDNNKTLKSVYRDLNFYSAPVVNDPSYSDLVKDIIRQKKIDFYIPLIDEEIVAAKRLEGFQGVKVLTPTIEFTELCLNKLSLMRALDKVGISSVQSTNGEQKIPTDYPVFVKPIYGRGSRGIRIINNAKELEAYYTLEKINAHDVLIQELIQGTEYTVGVTVSNLNDILEISIKRVISKKGITINAITERNDLIRKCVFKIVKEFRPCGPINVQLYVTHNGIIKIFEINPRFSTTTIMSYAANIDVISLYIEAYGKEYTAEPLEPAEGLVLYRRWENIFYES